MPILLALGLGPTACGRGCGCVEGEKTYETLDGKVKVSLVRSVHWSSGRIPGPMSDFFLRVATEPSFEHRIACTHAEMAEDADGKFVAYRCENTTTWNVLRLRGGDRHLFECNAPVGEAKQPVFEKLTSVREAGRRILDCNPDWPTMGPIPTWKELTRSIAEDEGAPAAVDFVMESAAYPLPAPVYEEPWVHALDVLPAEGRSQALARLCSSLRQEDAPATLYVRAARRCALDVSEIGKGAVAQFKARLSEEPDSASAPHGLEYRRTSGGLTWDERALLWSAALATTKSAAPAGEVACATIPKLAESVRDDLRVAVAAAVVARTKTRCPTALSLLDPPPCSELIDCDGGLCRASDLARADQGWNKWLIRDQAARGTDAGVRFDPARPDTSPMILAAAYVQGPLPKEVLLPNARRHYRIEATDAGPCRESGPRGASCTCTDGIAEWTICQMKVDETRGAAGWCGFHVDDAQHRFDDVRRMCEPEGAPCDFSHHHCCGDLECNMTDDAGCTRPLADASK